jgi:hypothetical protein
VDSRQIGILVGGCVWCGLLFRPTILWLVAEMPDLGVNLVFGVGGILGFLACASAGIWIAGRIARRAWRSR